MNNRKVLIIKTGSKIAGVEAAGDYDRWIMTRGGLTDDTVRVVEPMHEPLPDSDTLRAVIITGSAAMVTDDTPWVDECKRWLQQALTRPLPMLGICFGHQLLAAVLGGRVDYNPRGVEVGITNIDNLAAHSDDMLLGTLPAVFAAPMSHQQSVLDLPPGAQRLATTALDDCAAFVYQRRIWGLQFHPEFDAAITRHYIERNRALLERQGRDAALLLAACRDHPLQHRPLQRFVTAFCHPSATPGSV